MATAKRVSPVPVEVPPDTIVLELTLDEAHDLKALTGVVCAGTGPNKRMGASVSSVYRALGDADVHACLTKNGILRGVDLTEYAVVDGRDY